LHSVLGIMRGAVGESVLARGFIDDYGNLQNDKVAELFQGLLDAATTDVDKAVLQRCVQDVMGIDFRRDIADLVGQDRDGFAAARIANRAEMKPFLNSAFAAQIAAGVAARTGGSRKDVHPAKIPGPLGLLVEARIDDQIREIKRTALINKHPIQVALDIREIVPSDSDFWENPILTSYDTPCAEDVVALLGELSQAATTATDKSNLRDAIGTICFLSGLNPWSGKEKEDIKALADVAHQQSSELKKAARKLASNKTLAQVIDNIYAQPIAAYVAAQVAAQGRGNVPTEVVGGRAEPLVQARAEAQMEAAKKEAFEQADRTTSPKQRAARAEILVDAREKMSAQLRGDSISPTRRERLTKALGTHVAFASPQERDQVLNALSYEEQGQRNPDCEPGEKFLHGWPLSKDGTVALDQAILYERDRRRIPLAPEPAPQPAPEPAKVAAPKTTPAATQVLAPAGTKHTTITKIIYMHRSIFRAILSVIGVVRPYNRRTMRAIGH
jgi:hypothetical protein